MKFNVYRYRMGLLALAILGVTLPLAVAQTTRIDRNVRINIANSSWQFNGDNVRFGQDFTLGAGEEANDVVMVGGKATINGKVKGDLVMVGGLVDLGPKAVISHDLVVVGGSLAIPSGATVKGDLVAVGSRNWLASEFKPGGDMVEIGGAWLGDWLTSGLARGLILPWDRGWAWVSAGICLLFNLLLCLLFPRSLRTCTEVARQKPLHAFLLGLLLMMLLGPVCILLAISCVGLIVVPFIGLATLLAVVFGTIGVYRIVGHQLGALTGLKWLENPLAALLAGSILFYALYAVPGLGVIVSGVVVTLALGIGIWATFGRIKREEAPTVSAPVAPPVVPNPVPAPAVVPDSVLPAPMPLAMTSPELPPVIVPDAASVPPPLSVDSVAEVPPVMPTPVPVPPVIGPTVSVPELTSLPRAGFWVRFASALIDLVLVGMLYEYAPHWLGSSWNGWGVLIYMIGMWAWKGTTIGGIVFGLKAVRTDGRPVDLAVAIVRGLASVLSLVFMGLGYFWIGWDSEKQGWHDKIAGTYVVRVPRGVSLI